MPWTVIFVTCVSSCLFLSPNPIIMFLQLCDMSGAVLDTCEGDFQGKLAPAHLALLPLASPASCLATTHPTSPSLTACGSDPPKACLLHFLPFPGSGRASWLRSLWLSEITDVFPFFSLEAGRHTQQRGPGPSFYPCHHLRARSPFLKLTVYPDNRPVQTGIAAGSLCSAQ